MGAPAVGSVVLVAFPYADFSKFKKRPALVVASAEFDNRILCQITSKAVTSAAAIPLGKSDFANGGLQLDSFVRPDKLFTVEPMVIEGAVGNLKPYKLAAIQEAIGQLFTSTNRL